MTHRCLAMTFLQPRGSLQSQMHHPSYWANRRRHLKETFFFRFPKSTPRNSLAHFSTRVQSHHNHTAGIPLSTTYRNGFWRCGWRETRVRGDNEDYSLSACECVCVKMMAVLRSDGMRMIVVLDELRGPISNGGPNEKCHQSRVGKHQNGARQLTYILESTQSLRAQNF